MEENTDILQGQVSDVYQKTLMSVPASVTSFFDNSDPELNVDSDFVTGFINTFKGSRLDNVTLRDASEESRLKVLQLFKEIERDLYRTRNSTVDISDYEGYLNILKMYLADRKVSDAVLNDAYYTVRNMAGRDPEVSDVIQKVKEKRDQIKAYMKSSRSGYKYTLDGIRKHFVSNGILNKIKLDDGNEDYVIDRDAVIKRPTEVEELMNALVHVIEVAKDVSDLDACDWAGQISSDAYDIGNEYIDNGNQDNAAVKAAVDACMRVGHLSQEKGDMLYENTTTDELANLDTTADPYMRIIFGMIRDGKVKKDKTGPITVVDVDAITSDDILHIYNNVKTAMFELGPNGSTSENEPVEFDVTFDNRMTILKSYIDFLYSDELKPAITRQDVEKSIRSKMTDSRKKLAAAYILTKSVHDKFNGGLMKYSGTNTVENEYPIPSRKSFNDEIAKNCSLFPKSDIDLEYVFNFISMFTTDSAYFPIEQIIRENPNMYIRMCQYRQGCIDAYAMQSMEKLSRKNVQVQYIATEFATAFNKNKLIKDVASMDTNCESIQMSSMIDAQRFADVFNVISDGIAYAAKDDVNDRVTEYRLWSILKTVANNTPHELGDAVKHEFVNVAHAQEDWQYRRHLAIKAGVLSKEKDNTVHFSGNFGTIVNNVNIQARRIDKIMQLFYRYSLGLLFINANEKLTRRLSMNVVMPYIGKVLDIAKEYNIAFRRNNAAILGCSDKWSTAIIDMLTPFVGG